MVIEIVKGVCEKVGINFIIIYCLFMLDLVEGGVKWDEVVYLVKEIEKVGVMLINIGIGWYEVWVFIIFIFVFCVVFIWIIECMKKEVFIFFIIINCINMFEVVELVFV